MKRFEKLLINVSGIYDGPLDTKILEWMTARKQHNQIQLVSEQVNQPCIKITWRMLMSIFYFGNTLIVNVKICTYIIAKLERNLCKMSMLFLPSLLCSCIRPRLAKSVKKILNTFLDALIKRKLQQVYIYVLYRF